MYKIGGNKFLLSGFLVFISGFFSVTFELLSIGSIVPLLNKLFEVNSKYLFKGNDQDAFNYVYRNKSKISKEFYVFPDSLFQCGLLYKMHIKKNFFPLVEELKPYFFHANFVVGINNKIKLLKFLSLWFLNKKIF